MCLPSNPWLDPENLPMDFQTDDNLRSSWLNVAHLGIPWNALEMCTCVGAFSYSHQAADAGVQESLQDSNRLCTVSVEDWRHASILSQLHHAADHEHTVPERTFRHVRAGARISKLWTQIRPQESHDFGRGRRSYSRRGYNPPRRLQDSFKYSRTWRHYGEEVDKWHATCL